MTSGVPGLSPHFCSSLMCRWGHQGGCWAGTAHSAVAVGGPIWCAPHSQEAWGAPSQPQIRTSGRVEHTKGGSVGARMWPPFTVRILLPGDNARGFEWALPPTVPIQGAGNLHGFVCRDSAGPPGRAVSRGSTTLVRPASAILSCREGRPRAQS